MNAEEIEIQRRGEDERRDPFLPDTALPKFDHLGHPLGGLLRRQGFESDPAAAIGVCLDDVHVLFLVSASIPNFAAAKFMQTLDRPFRDWKFRAPLVDEFQGIAITA